MYEIFLKTHLLFALATIVLLWLHVPLKYRLSTICLTIASAIWIFQESFWLGRLGYRNLRTYSSRTMSLVKYPSADGCIEAIELTLSLKRPWKVRPGEYVYLTMPRLSRRNGGFAQAHPYIIAWTEGADVTLLIERRSGFSNSLFTTPNVASAAVILDGPYGHAQIFSEYDKVLFIASGIGISAHLLAIRELLEAHENQSARVRRITLIWFLETAGMTC
jgi:predicted ferric reductase